MTRRHRIAWRYVLLVAPLVALVGLFFTGGIGIALATSGLNPDHWETTDGLVVSVTSGEVVNADEIEEARRLAAAEGVEASDTSLPEPDYSSCTVTFTYVVGSETLTSRAYEPRATEWCDQEAGAVIKLAYDPADPTSVTDDFNASWNAMFRTYQIINVVLVLVSVVGLVLIVRGHVHNARHRRAEREAVLV